MEDNVLVYERGDNHEAFLKLWDYAASIGMVPTVHESIVDKEWTENFKFCGCGNPEKAREYLVNLLQSMKDRSASSWEVNNVEKVALSEGVFYFVMYVLDAMRLTEHGGSVGGSWLTEKGEKMLEFLRSEHEGGEKE